MDRQNQPRLHMPDGVLLMQSRYFGNANFNNIYTFVGILIRPYIIFLIYLKQRQIRK
jgi:hypothetical protein